MKLLLFAAIFTVALAAPLHPGPYFCGNGRCDHREAGENCQSCPADCNPCPPCTPTCGDGFCSEEENPCSCPSDCGFCCVNDYCDTILGESFENCPIDCSIDIKGVVVDAVDQTPIPGVNVECFTNTYTLPEIQSSPAGVFLFEGIAPGTWTCRAVDPQVNYFEEVRNITILPSQISGLILTFPLRKATCHITGFVGTEGSDRGVGGALVSCASGPVKVPQKYTGNDGHFVFTGLSRGVWTCTAEAPGYIQVEPVQTTCEPVLPAALDVYINLEAHFTVEPPGFPDFPEPPGTK